MPLCATANKHNIINIFISEDQRSDVMQLSDWVWPGYKHYEASNHHRITFECLGCLNWRHVKRFKLLHRHVPNQGLLKCLLFWPVRICCDGALIIWSVLSIALFSSVEEVPKHKRIPNYLSLENETPCMLVPKTKLKAFSYRDRMGLVFILIMRIQISIYTKLGTCSLFCVDRFKWLLLR